MNTYAVYESNDEGEASGIVHFYCSYTHAEADLEAGVYDGLRIEQGIDSDFPDGTICERCGVALKKRIKPAAVVLIGNPISGFTIVGPFKSIEDAEDYAADLEDDDAWATTLAAPEFDEAAPPIIQTACGRCGQDIEGEVGSDEWRDRGNNPTCPSYRDRDGEIITPPEGTLHHPDAKPL